jgi:hypothetical protein
MDEMRQTLSVWANVWASKSVGASKAASFSANGMVGWLLGRMRGRSRPQARLAVLERITLAPRHSLALIEAEGRKLLVATSPDGAPVFYALDGLVPNAPRPDAARPDAARPDAARRNVAGRDAAGRDAAGQRGNAYRRPVSAWRSSC